jgi:hypothetical protein
MLRRNGVLGGRRLARLRPLRPWLARLPCWGAALRMMLEARPPVLRLRPATKRVLAEALTIGSSYMLMRSTDAATEIPLRFCSFHRRFFSGYDVSTGGLDREAPPAVAQAYIQALQVRVS